MSNVYRPKTVLGAAAQRAVRYAYQNRHKIAETLSTLYAKKQAQARASPSQVLKGTRLLSYLDNKYEKKCGTEIKQFFSATVTGTPTTTLATLVSPFVGIAQGLTDSTRIGDSIEVKKLRIRFTIRAGAASTAVSQVRIIVTKQGLMAGAVPTSNDILQTDTDIRSFYSQNKNETFQILEDRTFTVTPLTTNDDKTRYTWDYVYTPKGCHSIKWVSGDTTGVIGNMILGNICVKTMYEGGTAPALDFYVHGQYVDV